jgi:hypothetical protein
MYLPDPELLLTSFFKAYQSAVTNYNAAVALTEQDYHAQAESLGIVGLEEIGKMMLIDDFLFERTDGARYQASSSSQFAHLLKLDAIELYPDFLRGLAAIDPRRNEMGYRQTMTIAGSQFAAKRQKLAGLVGENFAFSQLDCLKHQGLYSHETDGTARANEESADAEVCRAVMELVRAITDTIALVLGPSLERYKSLFFGDQDRAGVAGPGSWRDDATEIFRGVLGLEDDAL